MNMLYLSRIIYNVEFFVIFNIYFIEVFYFKKNNIFNTTLFLNKRIKHQNEG